MSERKRFFSNFLQWPGFIFWLVGISMINWAFAEEPPEDVKAIFGFIFLFVGGGVWWIGILLVKKSHGKTWHELAELFGATAFLIGIGGFGMRMVDKPGKVGGVLRLRPIVSSGYISHIYFASPTYSENEERLR